MLVDVRLTSVLLDDSGTYPKECIVDVFGSYGNSVGVPRKTIHCNLLELEDFF